MFSSKPKPTPSSGSLDITKIQATIKSNVTHNIAEVKKAELEKAKKENEKLDIYIKNRTKICDTYISTIESTIKEMAKNGNTFKHLGPSPLVLKKTYMDNVRVTDTPCLLRIRDYFKSKYDIKTKYHDYSNTIDYDVDKGFTITLPTSMNFISTYLTHTQYNIDFTDKTALKNTYKEYMSYDYK